MYNRCCYQWNKHILTSSHSRVISACALIRAFATDESPACTSFDAFRFSIFGVDLGRAYWPAARIVPSTRVAVDDDFFEEVNRLCGRSLHSFFPPRCYTQIARIIKFRVLCFKRERESSGCAVSVITDGDRVLSAPGGLECLRILEKDDIVRHGDSIWTVKYLLIDTKLIDLLALGLC